MPSSITHAYVACDIYEKLDYKIKKKIPKMYLEDYKTYAQGPDIYYFYHILNPFDKKAKKIRNFGSLCHNKKTNELFITLTEKVKKSKNVDEFLLLIGLFTHYMTDLTTHPFINYQASLAKFKPFKRKDIHFIIETYLDNYFIQKREKVPYKKFKGYNFCFNLQEKENVKNLLNVVMQEVFKKNDMGEYYFKSLHNMKNFFKYLRYDSLGLKKVFYNIINPIAVRIFRDVRYLSYNFKLDHDSFLNLDHETWYNLDAKNITSQDSFLDLYDQVVETSKEMIEKLYNYIFLDEKMDLEKFFGNKSYSNGLPLK